LELNDGPNASFLLSNINKVLVAVTEHGSASDGDDGDVSEYEQDANIVELPYLATNSTFNELVIALITSKHDIQRQMQSATQSIAHTSSSSDGALLVTQSTTSKASLSSSFASSYHSLVSALLLSVQSQYKHSQRQAEIALHRERVAAGQEMDENPSKAATPTPASAPATSDALIIEETKVSEEALDASQLTYINTKVKALIHTLNQMKKRRQHATSSEEAAAVGASYRFHLTSLRNLLPLLDQAILLSERSLASLLRLHRSYLKMLHVLLYVLSKILARGFCRRPDEPDDDGEDDQQGSTEEMEGTGMGDGEGNKDVSDQITDEEQLLGTKDQLEDEQKQDQADPSNQQQQKEQNMDEGVEMEADFDGEMHDMPDEGEGETDDKDEDQKEELDREMGDLGDKQDVVDEKLWEDSDDDEDQSDEEKQKKKDEAKYEKNAPMEGADPNEDEIMAKQDDDEEEQQQPQSDKKDQKQPPQSEDEGAEEEPQPEPSGEEGEQAKDDDDSENEEEQPEGPINEDREDKVEESHGIDPLANMPDDLKLDEDEKDEGHEQEDGGEDDEQEDEDAAMDEGEELDPAKKAELESEQNQNQNEDEDANQPDHDDDGTGEDTGVEQEKNELDEQQDENPDEADQAEEQAQNTVEAPEAPDQADDESKEDENQEPDVERPDKHLDSDADKQHGTHRVAGGEQGNAGIDEQQEDEEGEREKAPPKAPNETDQDDDPNSSQQKADEQTLDQSNAHDADHGTESEYQPQSTQSHPASQPDTDQSKKKKRKDAQRQAPNPFKSLGDANKKWQERLKILDSKDEEAEDEDDTQLEEEDADHADEGEDEGTLDGTVENVSEKQKADGQMLGPVEQKLDAEETPNIKPDQEEEEDAVMKEDQQEPEEEEQETFDQPDPNEQMKPTDDDDDDTKKKDKRDQSKNRKRGGANKLDPSRMMEQPEQEDEEMSDDADEQQFDPYHIPSDDEDDGKNVESRIGAMADLPAAAAAAADSIHDPDDPERQAYLQRLRDDLDAALQTWETSSSSSSSASSDSTRAHALWSHLTELTHDLSSSLCESLRMILEPMLATKLRGDYKHGKRINIKKIIPYIASSFRKDKIWLKRTKPTKRTYQVLIAIDDSQSMRQHKAARLALEAMTLLCKALSQLEVGEISVASFGSAVQMLHPFHQPFTDESGAFALSHFQFDQSITRWPDLLESTVRILEEAKSNVGASSSSASSLEHHQLVFLISDARVQQDRELVAKWTREALSRKQLLVLIIVESGSEKDSILETKTVSYPNGKLTITNYLDEFPFPYYIILRDIQSLPEIVADALRQWFELMRATHSV